MAQSNSLSMTWPRHFLGGDGMTIKGRKWGWISAAYILLGVLVWWMAEATRGYTAFDGFNLLAVVFITVGVIPEKEGKR